jgi:hypothetical protein
VRASIGTMSITTPPPGLADRAHGAKAGSWSRRLRSAAAVAAGAAGALLIAGCGGHSPAAQVASAPASARGAQSSAPAVTGGQPAGLQGPTVPDNATGAQLKRLVNPYYECLQQHGDQTISSKPGGLMAPGGPVPAAAAAACAALRPHPPWQQLPQYNPHYQQDMAAWVNCMNAHGVPSRLVPGGFTFTGAQPADLVQVQTQCEMSAFGDQNAK